MCHPSPDPAPVTITTRPAIRPPAPWSKPVFVSRTPDVPLRDSAPGGHLSPIHAHRGWARREDHQQGVASDQALKQCVPIVAGRPQPAEQPLARPSPALSQPSNPFENNSEVTIAPYGSVYLPAHRRSQLAPTVTNGLL